MSLNAKPEMASLLRQPESGVQPGADNQLQDKFAEIAAQRGAELAGILAAFRNNNVTAQVSANVKVAAQNITDARDKSGQESIVIYRR